MQKEMQTKSPLNPWYYVPSAYFMEGLPWAVINLLAGIIFVRMGVSIEKYAFWTGLLGLPWIIKAFLAPLVDGNKTKRFWIVFTQYLISVVFLLAAIGLNFSSFFQTTWLCFFIGAFLSATHDIALDGYYMIALSEKKQAFFLGIRNTVYRAAMLTVSGPLVVIAGVLERKTGNIGLSWAAVLAAAAAFGLLLNTYHLIVLPRPAGDAPQKAELKEPVLYLSVFKSYLTQKNILFILLFILIYPMSDALLGKIALPFLLKAKETGALALSTQAYGVIQGTFGLLASMTGAIGGGLLIAKFGFRKCIWWFAALMLLPNILYAFMAFNAASVGEGLVAFFVIFENLGDGIGFIAFTFFVMVVSNGAYKTSFYAISTSIMALSQMGFAMFSGKLFTMLGSNYAQYFLVVSFMSLLTFLLVPLSYKVDKMKLAQSNMEK